MITIRPLVIGVTSAVSLVAGAALGYVVAKKRLEKLYEERTAREIAEAKQYYSMIYKTDGYGTPESAAQTLGVFEQAVEAMRSYRGESSVKTPPHVEERNVFLGRADMGSMSYEDEVRSRSGDGPYVISRDDFFQGEYGYEQQTLTYYAGDGGLADERDELVDQINFTVGDDNMERFGHWSDDPNVVYIRNDRLRLDFEVIRSEGRYSVEVMGMDPEGTRG